MFRGFRCYRFRRLIDIQAPDVVLKIVCSSLLFDENAEVSWCSWMFCGSRNTLTRRPPDGQYKTTCGS